MKKTISNNRGARKTESWKQVIMQKEKSFKAAKKSCQSECSESNMQLLVVCRKGKTFQTFRLETTKQGNKTLT